MRPQLRWDDPYLVCKVLTEGELGPADRAKHIATVGEFANSHFFAESDFSELAAIGAFQLSNLKFTTSCSLTEGQGRINLEFGGKDWHRVGGI